MNSSGKTTYLIKRKEGNSKRIKMTKHMSVRLLWHDSGWNGCICKNPRKNTYCYADKAVPITLIKDKKQDLDYLRWEDENAGRPCSGLDKIPRCTWSINAFSPRGTKFTHVAQLFMKAGDPSVRDFDEDMPPCSMGTWRFDDMYPTRLKKFKGVNIYTEFYVKQREQLSRQYFEQFDEGKSLVFTYLNTDNPLNNERETYVLVGVCRLKEKGIPQRWTFQKEKSSKTWGNLVWSRRISQSYSAGEGIRIPYQEILEYQENHPEVGDLISPVLFEIDNGKEIVRKFKYVSRDLSDIEAATILEPLFSIVRKLKEYQEKYGICKNIDWELKKRWLDKALASTYMERSKYPGIVAALDCLKFSNARLFFNEVLRKKERQGVDIKEYVLGLLDGQPIEKEFEEAIKKARKRWSTYSPDERRFMMNVLSLIELRPTFSFESENGTEIIVKNQIEKILEEDREHIACIKSSVDALAKNPYLICEEYYGEEEDDFITFDRIDAAFFPNEEYFRLDESLKMDRNDPRRVRARIIQILENQKSNGNCFLNINEVLELLNKDDRPQRISVTLRDLKAEKEFYKEKLFWKEVDGQIYLYLAEVYEMEKLIENRVRDLISIEPRKSPNANWPNLLRRPDDAKFEPRILERIKKEKSQALENSFINCFSIITGIAGSGKTTVLETLIKEIGKHGKQPGKGSEQPSDFLLLAPTGKAAIRLSEVGERAFTIDYILHRKRWGHPVFENKYKEQGDLIEAKNIIIDESSMIDLEKLSVLFKAIDWEVLDRLILVGDVNQLPPIGLGKPFFDIIHFLKNKPKYKGKGFVNYLTVNCRQILTNSQAAKLAGVFMSSEEEENPFKEEMLLKILAPCKLGKDLEVDYWEDELELPELIYRKIDEIAKEEFEDYDDLEDYEGFNRLIGAQREELNNKYSVDFFQIISPYKQEFFGTLDLNYILQHKYHSKLWSYSPGRRPAMFGRVADFTHFDKIIQIRNRYNQWFQYDFKRGRKNVIIDFLANGQLGITRIWKSDLDKKRYLLLEFKGDEDKLLKADANYAKNYLELAYVLTVHKVQGNQFNVVILILPEKKALIRRELIYTALTRHLDKIIILIQNSAKYNLLRAMTDSSILDRNSSIFFHYDVKTPSENLRRRLTENHIHRTKRPDKIELVTSKSEVIIANMLLDEDVPYEYERVLGDPNFPVKPDFTIFDRRGEPILYWEHLGMLGEREYDQKWERKRQGYENNGYKIISKEELKDVENRKSVLITKERKGAIDSIEIQKTINEIKNLQKRIRALTPS